MAAYAAPVRIARWSALLFAAATFVLSLVIFFRIAANGYNFGNLNNPVVSIRLPWIDFTTRFLLSPYFLFSPRDGKKNPERTQTEWTDRRYDQRTKRTGKG